MFYYFPPYVLPSFLTLQDTFSSLSQSFAFSVSLLPLFSRLFNPFLSIQNPILFRGSHYLGPFFASAPLTLFLCTSAHVRNFSRFALCSLAFHQLNEEATVTWKMASLYLPTNVFLFVYLRTGSIFYSFMHLVQQFIT